MSPSPHPTGTKDPPKGHGKSINRDLSIYFGCIREKASNEKGVNIRESTISINLQS